jgi:adenylate cyclase
MVINRIGPERLVAYQAAVFVTAVAAAIALAALYMHAPRSTMELKTEDMVQRLAPQPARPDVVILALDDASVARYGPVKDWPRSVLARGLRDVESGGAKGVVMDLALDQRTQTGDADLWRTIANNRNVVLGMAYDANRGNTYTPDDIRSLVFLEKYALAGNITYDPTQLSPFIYYLFEPPVSDFAGSSAGVGVFVRETDNDAVVRTARMTYLSHVQYPASTAPLRGKFPQSNLADGAPVMLPNITLEAALRSFQMDKEDVSLRTGDSLNLLGHVDPAVNIPVDPQARMSFRYAGPPGTFSRVSFVDLIDGKVNPTVFRDKLVIVGATAPKDPATDARLTPYPGLMPRVEITANAITTVLNRTYYGRYETRIPGIMIIIGLVTGLVMMFVSGLRAVITGLVMLVGYLVLSVLLFAYGLVMLPILPGAAVILLTLLVALALYAGPYKPLELEASPTYIPPPAEAVR